MSSNRFTILNSNSWELTADSASIAVSDWEDFNTVVAPMVAAANPGDTIDLTGRYLLGDPAAVDSYVTVSASDGLTFEGGTFARGLELIGTPTGVTDVYTASWDFTDGTDFLSNPPWITRPGVENALKLQAYPEIINDREFGGLGDPDLDAELRDDFGLGAGPKIDCGTGGADGPQGSGPVFSGGQLTGIRLGGTDAVAAKAAFDWDLTAGDINDTRGTTLVVKSSDNRVKWCVVSSVTETAGVITFNFAAGVEPFTEAIVNATYLSTLVQGPVAPNNLLAGQACFLPMNQEILFRPRVNSEDSTIIIGFGASAMFRMDTDYTYPDTYDSHPSSTLTQFKNMTFATGSEYIQTSNPRLGTLVNIENCQFYYSTSTPVSRVQGRVKNCIFDQNFYAGINVYNNTLIEGCYMGVTYDSSCINSSSVSDMSYGFTETEWQTGTGGQGVGLPVTVNRCLFANPSTNHGQGVSFYSGSCFNMRFTNNIVVNMQRGFSVSPSLGGDPAQGLYTSIVPSQMYVANNIWYTSDAAVDHQNTYVANNGQTMSATWDFTKPYGGYGSMVGDFADATEPFPAGYEYACVNNTVLDIRDAATSGPNHWLSTGDITQPGNFYNNYAPGITGAVGYDQYAPSFSPTVTPISLRKSKNNVFEGRGNNSGNGTLYGQYNSDNDYRLYTNTTGYSQAPRSSDPICNIACDKETFTVGDLSIFANGVDLTTLATDGGSIGARYTAAPPTLDQIKEMLETPVLDWSAPYAPVDLSTLDTITEAGFGVSDFIELNGNKGTIIGTVPLIDDLVDGAVPLGTWSAFTEGANGDGQGTTLGGDETDPRILSDTVPARFITPWVNDIAETEYMDVIVHPVGGVTDAGSPNSYTVYMYLNGGAPVQAKPRIREGKWGNSPYQVFSCKVPAGLTGSNEVRAVVVPTYGKATILQSQMVAGNLETGTRGCLLHEYTHEVTVGPTGTYATVDAAIAATGTTATRCLLQGSTYEENAIFTFEDAGYSGLNDPTGRTPIPIVKGDGSQVIIGSTVAGRHGVIIDSCQVYNKPDLDVPGVNAAIRNPRSLSGAAWTSSLSGYMGYFSLRNVTGGIKKDTTHYPEIPVNANTTALVAKGLAIPLLMFYRGWWCKAASLNFAKAGTFGFFKDLHNCDLMLSCSLAAEVVDTRTTNPPPGWDVYNSTLCVGSAAEGVAKQMYPWCSVGGDVIDDPFTYDYTIEDSGSVQKYSEVNTHAKAITAFNDGVWPDWANTSDKVTVMIDQTWIDNGDGTYTDHHGVTTTGWPHSYTTGNDPHFDTVQLSGGGGDRIHVGATILAHFRGFGDLRDVQSVFATTYQTTSMGVWDWRTQPGDSAQVGLRLGIANGGFSNRAQHWGPEYTYASVSSPDGLPNSIGGGGASVDVGYGQIYARPSDANIASMQSHAAALSNWDLYLM